MFKKYTQEDGLRIISVPQKNSKAVTVLVVVGAGSKYENKNNNGISHFLEHMLFKGTKKRPNALKIAETLDKIGGAYNAFTSKEYTGYFAKVEYDYIDLALDWVSDIFLNSKILPKEIEKERGVIIEEMNMYEDTPLQNVENIFEELLYGDAPAGWKTIGTKESILNAKRKDFIDYLDSHYSSKNTIVCISGNFKERETIGKVKKAFAKMNKNDTESKPVVQDVQENPQVKIRFKKTDQTHFCLGVRGYSLLNENRYHQELLSIILGGNMSSRLFIEVREKRGLAYYIHTTSETYTDSGFLSTQAGVPHKDLENAIKVILKEYKSIQKNSVSEAELKKAKDYLKGSMSLSLEQSDAQASFYGAQELLTGEVLTLQEKLDIINRATVKSIHKVAKDIFRLENLNLALIGPHKNERELQNILKF